MVNLMDDTNSNEFIICTVCGHEKKCFLQHESDMEWPICPDCLFAEDRDF